MSSTVRAWLTDPLVFHDRINEGVDPHSAEYRRVHPNAWHWEPCGARITVVLDAVPTEVGRIVIPDTVADKESVGTGVVLAAGPYAGAARDCAYPWSVDCEAPDLLYRRVVFGSRVGKYIHYGYDRRYNAIPIQLQCRDLWYVEFSDTEGGQNIVKEFKR